MSTIRVNAIQHTTANDTNMTLFANGNIAMTTANALLRVGNTVISNAGISVGGSLYGGFGPAFSAANTTASFSIPGATYLKLNFPVENFDTASCYDPSLSRFTPNIAGYYHIGARLNIAAYSNRWSLLLYKNGSYFALLDQNTGNGTNDEGVFGSTLAYANGTSDYFEIYVQGNNTSTFYGYVVASYSDFTFYAHLARPA